MNNNQVNLNNFSTKQVFLFVLFAYCFSFLIRMIWVYQFQGNANFIWNGELMINTNDGYYFASGVKDALTGAYSDNPRIPNFWSYGLVFITTFLVKVTPFSIETITLYLPAVISSLVVIPIILIARLYGESLWGFFAALLGSIAWSYYNRTMVGYYDTDMFSAMAPMFILFFLMKSTIDFNLKSALYASIAIAIYPFLYDAGLSVVYAMGMMYALYMLFYHRNSNITYLSLILIFISLLPFPLLAPWGYIAKVIVLIGLYFAMTMQRKPLKQKKLMVITLILFISFLFFGNVFGLIFSKIMGYIATGTNSEGLHFYSVVQTVREAGKIPFSIFANRISGSQLGVLLSFIGYIVLVIKHRAFILALPLVAIGGFALIGGLRFTVYAVPIAAMSVVYLFHMITQMISDKRSIYLLAMGGMTALMIYPNIVHIVGYKVPTVLNKAEVEDLTKLKSISNNKDYTLAWWDYGYPIWYYSNTNTLIDGGKHSNDNFIISKIMQTYSSELAANLSRLAVETYVDSNYTVAANMLFSNVSKENKDPNLLLSELENGTYVLPKKTRDIYLYLPYKMLNIFPTVALFGNLDLITGKVERKISFYPTPALSNNNGEIRMQNGIVFDAKKGQIVLGKQTKHVKYFIVTQNTQDGKIDLKSQLYNVDGEYAVIYMKSYGKFIIMDAETFKSMYVQMFILGKYDKNLFELVVSSPYSRIYRLKK